MTLLSSVFPNSCSRLKIFICYSHDSERVAQDIAQAVKNDGHEVFIDSESLKASSDYNEKIRNAIYSADQFIFLISQGSIAPGKYTLTELSFAEQRWPQAEGNIWPVLLDPSVDVSELPASLRSVQIYKVKGNAAAEVAAEIDKTRRLRPGVLISVVIGLLVLGGAMAFIVSKGRKPQSTNPAISRRSTFQQTCTNVQFSIINNEPTISADCSRLNSKVKSSTLVLRGIVNMNGRLAQDSGPSTFQKACKDMQISVDDTAVALSATCPKKTGQFEKSSLPINGIENINGSLTY